MKRIRVALSLVIAALFVLAGAGWGQVVRADHTTSRPPISLENGNQLTRLAVLVGNSRTINEVTFSEDGTLLAAVDSGFGGTAIVFDVATQTARYTLTGNSGYYSAAFSPDASLLALGECMGQDDNYQCNVGGVSVYEIATGTLLRTLEGHMRAVLGVAFSPDGTRLASAGSADMTARLWDATTGANIAVLQGSLSIGDVLFSPDGSLLIATDGSLVQLWNATTGEAEGTLTLDMTQLSTVLALSPDGSTLAVGTMLGQITLWDLANRSLLKTIEAHTGPLYSLAFSPDGTFLASGGSDYRLRLWNIADSTQLVERSNYAVTSLDFSPDGTMLALGNENSGVELWGIPMGDEPPYDPGIQPKPGYYEGEGVSFTVTPEGTLHELFVLGNPWPGSFNQSCVFDYNVDLPIVQGVYNDALFNITVTFDSETSAGAHYAYGFCPNPAGFAMQGDEGTRLATWQRD